MNRYKGKMETAKRGFIPHILTYDGEGFVNYVLDNSYVEYGTGCWVDKGGDPELAYEAQMLMWGTFVGGGPAPEEYFVYNNCNDFRICYNPNCLDVMEAPDYEA